jgi:hypothetical protein
MNARRFHHQSAQADTFAAAQGDVPFRFFSESRFLRSSSQWVSFQHRCFLYRALRYHSINRVPRTCVLHPWRRRRASWDGAWHIPPFVTLPSKGTSSVVPVTVTDLTLSPATNGAPPSRPSPQPASPAMTNGKPSSSYDERNRPLTSGTGAIPQSVVSRDPKAAAQAASDMRNIVRRKLTGYVGFANLPNQWHRKSVRKGFNFNVMVVGR